MTNQIPCSFTIT